MRSAPEEGGRRGIFKPAEPESASDDVAPDQRAPYERAPVNCWRVERADRVAVLVDAAAYFAALADALERAERSVMIIGWDIHSQCEIGRRRGDDKGEALVDALDRITRARPTLEVQILSWDSAPLYAFEREILPQLAFAWHSGARVQLRLADDHPPGASHHQKIVSIDDRLAFIGGVDLTIGRWDEPSHEPVDARRRLPLGGTYPPFHDVQLALSGAPAKALSDLARERWRRATGKTLAIPNVTSDPWPEWLAPGARDVRVAIARTEAPCNGRPPVREVEQLYLDCIAAAERALYVENQFLSSHRIEEALRARLAEPNGPEVVVVTPLEQAGRLEQSTMGALRARLVSRLREADVHDRLRVLSPLVRGGVAVNLHAKVMVVDDRILRLGSANLSNRSMRLDTECDAAVEAENDETRAFIGSVRDGLLAEHLGVAPEAVRDAIAREGSLIAAITSLLGGQRTLVDLTPSPDEVREGLLLDESLLDPTQALDEALVARALPGEMVNEGRRRFPRLAIAVVAALALLVLGATLALSDAASTRDAVRGVGALLDAPEAPWLALAIFVAASLARVPVTVLVSLAVLALGPWIGAAIALAGSLLSVGAGYGLGRTLSPARVRRMARHHVEEIGAFAARGLIGVITLRVVPVAPFTTINLLLGGARIPLRHALLGTLLGIAPGIAAFALVATRVIAAARDPGAGTIAVAALAVLALVLALFGLRRVLAHRYADASEEAKAGGRAEH